MWQNVDFQKFLVTGFFNTMIVLVSLLFVPNKYYIFPWVYLIGIWIVLGWRLIISPYFDN